MKLGIMQPYFCPYLGYFQLIKCVDKFVVYDDVNFIKRGWINRNRILLNNSPHMFSIPLIKPSQNRLITETFVNEEVYPEWKRKFLRTLEYGYCKKADFFNQTYNIVEEILNYDISSKTISELNVYGIKLLCEHLNIGTEIVPTSTTFENDNLKGQARVIDICKKTGADKYINAIGGMSLYDTQSFLEHGLNLGFVRTNEFDYEFWNLSIIHLLMVFGREEVIKMLEGYLVV